MKGRSYWQMINRVKASSREPNMVAISEVHAETGGGLCWSFGTGTCICSRAPSRRPGKARANLIHCLRNRGPEVAAPAGTSQSQESCCKRQRLKQMIPRGRADERSLLFDRRWSCPLLSLAWAEEAGGGWEAGRGKEGVAKVAEQAC